VRKALQEAALAEEIVLSNRLEDSVSGDVAKRHGQPSAMVHTVIGIAKW
jgi:hypothetical protein